MTTTIIISHAYTNGLKAMTQGLIDALNSDPHTEFQIVVVEGTAHQYSGAMTVKSCNPFNYNRACNIGMEHATGEYIAFLNNDLQPKPGWAAVIQHAFDRDPLLMTASPWCGNAHHGMGIRFRSGILYGHVVRKHVAGWAIVARREFIDLIGGKLDEGVEFHYSDDLLIAQMLKAKTRHALVTASRVDHMESRTLHSIPRAKQDEYTEGQKDKYLAQIEKQYKGVPIRRKRWQK